MGVSKHIKRKRGAIDALIEPSESSKIVNEETNNHKRLRRAEATEESDNFNTYRETSPRNIKKINIDETHLELDNFCEVSYSEYRSHILHKLMSYINDLKFLKNERVAFQNKMKSQHHVLMALQKKVSALEAEKASLEQNLDEKDESLEKIDQKHNRDLQNAQKTLLTHDAAKQALAKQKAKYQNKLSTSNHIMVTLQKEVEDLVKKNMGLKITLKDSKDHIDSLNQYVYASDQSNEDMKNEISRLQRENKVLKENLEREKARCENQELH